MDITYRFWEDDTALFGPDADLSNVDIKASYASYKVAVYNAIKAAYPDADVSVSTGAPTGVFVYLNEGDIEDEDEAAWIEEIIHKTWEAWDWEVEK